MKAQLIEVEQTFEKFKDESEVDFEEELESYRKKYIEYELKFNDKLGETQRLQSALVQKARRLVERETVLNAMEAKLAEINEQNKKLNAECKHYSNEKNELQRKFDSFINTLKVQVNMYSNEELVLTDHQNENKQLKKSVDNLNATLKDMQETNDFLSSQINKMNQHIYELNTEHAENKENSTIKEVTTKI